VIDTLAWEQHTGANVVMARGGAEFFFPARFFDFPLLKLIPDGSGVVEVDRHAAEGPAASKFRVSATRRTGDTIFSRDLRIGLFPRPVKWSGACSRRPRSTRTLAHPPPFHRPV
jgi:hypothetical protein